MELRLFLFSTSTLSWDAKSLLRCPFYVLQGLRKEKTEWVYTRQKISIYQSFLIWEYGILQGSLVNEMNLKSLLYYLGTIRLKGEVNFFISRGFLEVFYLPNVFIGIGYSALMKGIFHLKSFSFKCFQSWGIKSIVNLYILLYSWQ